MLKFKVFIVIIFSVFTSVCYAQTPIKVFSADSARFMQEMTDFFIEDNKKEGKEFMQEFMVEFFSGKFSEKEKDNIYRTSNFMLKKRLKPFPDFKSYLSIMIKFANSPKLKESYNSWQISLEQVIEKSNSRRFADFIYSSELLFTENIIYQTSTISWKSNNSNFTFEFDSLPFVSFPMLDLKCESKNDSTVIYNTSGICYITEGKWIGSGGNVNWLRTGIDDKTIIAELKDYNIALKMPYFKADSVTFYNLKYFDHSLLGSLEDKILANVTERSATYPRFESYDKRFEIKNIIDSVDYNGGFSMVGSKFIGSGSETEPALLTFYRNKKKLFVASSDVFLIRKERISSDKAAIKIFLENDSIFHPGLQLKLITSERELTLFRDGKGISLAPYYNSYHKVDMDFEALFWKLDQPLVQMQGMKGSTKTDAKLESYNLYLPYLYDKLFTMSPDHILLVLRDISKKFNSREFLANDVSKNLGYSMNDVGPMLFILSNLGFVSYNTITQKVILKDKLFYYIDYNARRRDYDVIEFNSDIQGLPNATLNLDNYNIALRGIPQINLSDSQNVFIYPKGNSILLKKNRDFDFSGRVHAGLFDLYGKEFSFDYETFKINLIKVDSLSISVKTEEVDDEGRIKMKRVKTVIEDIQGDLLLDAPTNKSGLLDNPNYPIINSRKESYVYYDRPNIQKGVYKRDKFYFKLEPFSFDSINSFQNEALKFKGLFVSAGIFPDFEEELALQEDYSLGFKRKAPAGGYPVYGGKAQFMNNIKLSHEGLKGDGSLKYLGSTTWSDDMMFFPDSVNALAQKHEELEQAGKVEFPQVMGEGVYTHYRPKLDIMQIDKKTSPISMFNNQTQHYGTLFLEPSGLRGKGLMTFEVAEMESNDYKYKLNEFFTDTCNFRLTNTAASEFAFKTNNVNAHVDFNNRSAKFKPNTGGSFVEFPMNQYICFVEEFTWFMDKQEIALAGTDVKKSVGSESTNSDMDLKGSQFISVHPKQDSLNFFSTSSIYNLNDNIIYSKGVKYFNVADALLYPDSGSVIVEKKAKMRTLENATIIANNVTKYHSIYNSTIDVSGKKSYQGSGLYDYLDENLSKQEIKFEKIIVDTTGQTYAEGRISEDKKFQLSPNFDFKGEVKLESKIKYLTFDGAARINHYCDPLAKNWLKFQAEINPIEIYIPISNDPEEINSDKLSLGLMLSNDSVGIYSSFLSKKMRVSDSKVLTADGFLVFDKVSQEYRVSNKEKLNEQSLPGNYVSLNSKDCILNGEGKMDLGADLGQVKLLPIGIAKQNLFNNISSFDLIMPVDFFFEENALEQMADILQKDLAAEPIDFTKITFEKGIRELMGKEEGDKVISNFGLYGSLKKTPDELIHNILFTDIKFNWSNETHSYRSEGKIGVSSILKKQINKLYNGHIEVIKKRTGDLLHIYIEVEGGGWYYFNYEKNLMTVISSNEEFNKIIKELKGDKRKYDNKKGEASFRYVIGTVRKKEDFIRRITNTEEEEESGGKDKKDKKD